ncbi:DUF1835 domain-containing protein [Agarivorans aestuarii]|uniref:DUF1835 domain-containing protein n=1 Tax=Agarivorans aestuarii TaxID=1563703 RepID=A0ABU7G147_9ALTE|nr:DUF1835 domain-containing protein [Agarivorans aestuarii]MEE1673123.1 DUF1835 domain-containing protein [Agarivorans aestuarii]
MQLHITNGDSVGDMLSESQQVQGEILCWRDVLHDGPIIAAEGQAYLKARASFIYETMCLPSPLAAIEISEQQIIEGFAQRQAILDNLNQYNEIVLWFEHDLYDQLQLAECLYHLAKHQDQVKQFYLICIGEHDDVDYFHGLGNLSISQLEVLYLQRQRLSIEQLDLGKTVWQAIAANTPEPLNQLLSKPLTSLPFMANALTRFAQEYPWLDNGLSFTQTLILQSLAEPKTELPILLSNLRQQAQYQGEDLSLAEQRYQQIMDKNEIKLGRLFINLQSIEEAPFLGDIWLTKELHYLSTLSLAYLNIDYQGSESWDMQASYQISEAGLKALQGALAPEEKPKPNFWRGGVHITAENYWCWDKHKRQLVKQH